LNKRLRIAALSRTTYWQGMRGGMDVHGKLLAQGLAARGHRVVFIATRHPSGKTLEIDNGVELHYLLDTVFGSRRHGWAEKSVRALETLHKQQPFDLLWSQSFDGFGLAKASSPLARLPSLATLHGSIEQEFTSFIQNMRHRRYNPAFLCKGMAGLFYSYFITQRPLLRYARRIVTVSRKAAEDIQKWYGARILDKCVTIYNGVDTGIFHPDEKARDLIRRRYGIPPQGLVILTLGRLTHEKGHHLLIEALALLRKKLHAIKLLIVGEGENLPALQSLAKKLSVVESVIFTGPVENRETASYYNAADLFLFPTLTVEGLPFVLLEAMACGKPVIASDRGGNREVIRSGENGILIPPGSSQRIADEIELFAAHCEMADRLRRGALSTIRGEFDLVRMIDRMEGEMTAVAALQTS
jgi:glycosyltransferase involved in cell wall biosynthesis